MVATTAGQDIATTNSIWSVYFCLHSVYVMCMVATTAGWGGIPAPMYG